MTPYQEIIAKSRYARFLYDEGRRETWEETVSRYISFFKDRFDNTDLIPWIELENAILNFEIVPSMRCLMSAGKALSRDEIAGYNCSYIPIDSLRAFDEALYILMCSVGVGFSVERQLINKLPILPEEFYPSETTIIVRDSKIGWATSFRELLSLLYSGQIPKWDLSRLRPEGAVLKTFGGRSSGPKPLDNLFKFCCNVIPQAKGRRLTSVECHDIMCRIAEIVVCGGVRRAALISLSNVSDDRMRIAKSGQWWIDNPQRQMANNSAVYDTRPEMGIFMQEFLSLYESKSGERGIINRTALKTKAKETGRRDYNFDFGLNPCGEIILRPNQFCNLSEVIVRKGDSKKELKRKVRLASILGTMQTSLVNFRYIRKIWAKNTKEESLLGVSLTGIMDNKILSTVTKDLKIFLANIKEVAIDTNKEFAEKLNLIPSKAVTCVKPSGTTSALVDSAPGIHPRFSKFYIRRIRIDKKDPISELLQSLKYPVEEDSMNNTCNVFSFPMKSPISSKFVQDFTAIEQLEHWLCFKKYWCEHNPSITIYVKEDEWMKVGAWVYEHFDNLCGLSFLPHTDHIYQQAPYEAITKKEYTTLLKKMPSGINWEDLQKYEQDDCTSAAKELACSSGGCEF